MMRRTWYDAILLVAILAVVFTCLIVYTAIPMQRAVEACEAAGGTMIKAYNGAVCGHITPVQPKEKP